MKYAVRFYSLSGDKFETIRKETFETIGAAKLASVNHAESADYSNVKFVDDDWTIRVTATTPNGRSGRNIASIEPDGDFS